MSVLISSTTPIMQGIRVRMATTTAITPIPTKDLEEVMGFRIPIMAEGTSSKSPEPTEAVATIPFMFLRVDTTIWAIPGNGGYRPWIL